MELNKDIVEASSLKTAFTTALLVMLTFPFFIFSSFLQDMKYCKPLTLNTAIYAEKFSGEHPWQKQLYDTSNNYILT